MPLDPDTAQEFGELTGAVRALTQQFIDLRREIVDQNAQTHEIKHTQANQGQQVIIINERLTAHLSRYDRDTTATIDAIKDNRTISQNTIRETGEKVARDLAEYRVAQADQLSAHRESLAEDIAEIKAAQQENRVKMDDLLTWRGKILGGLAIIGVLVGIFGNMIIGLVRDFIGSFHH